MKFAAIIEYGADKARLKANHRTPTAKAAL